MTLDPYQTPDPHVKVPAPRVQKTWGTRLLELVVVGAIVLVLLAFFIPGGRRGRDASRRMLCSNQIRQIGLALQYYSEKYGSLPPACTFDESGKPLHSWRTLLLPYLEQGELYKQIDLSKPWDDPVNAKFHNQQVSCFTCRSSPSSAGTTSYMAAIGPKTAMQQAKSHAMRDIKNRSSILIFEVRDEKPGIHWMSPQDSTWEAGIHSWHPGGGYVLMSDLSVHFLPKSLETKLLEQMMDIEGSIPQGALD